jgi:hypothetical protein
MNGLEYDTSQTGLRAVFKDWQETTLHTIMENPQGLNSRETWEKVNQKLARLHYMSQPSPARYATNTNTMPTSTSSTTGTGTPSSKLTG